MEFSSDSVIVQGRIRKYKDNIFKVVSQYPQ